MLYEIHKVFMVSGVVVISIIANLYINQLPILHYYGFSSTDATATDGRVGWANSKSGAIVAQVGQLCFRRIFNKNKIIINFVLC